MVLANSHRISPVPRYSGYQPTYNLTCTGLSPSLVTSSNRIPFQLFRFMSVLLPRYNNSYRFGLFRVRSPLLAESLIVFFSSRYWDVSVPWVLLLSVLIAFLVFNQEGFPIRTSTDITVVCTSPQLFAAYHVLRRLWEPRHPPYALICFLSFIVPNLLLKQAETCFPFQLNTTLVQSK